MYCHHHADPARPRSNTDQQPSLVAGCQIRFHSAITPLPPSTDLIQAQCSPTTQLSSQPIFKAATTRATNTPWPHLSSRPNPRLLRPAPQSRNLDCLPYSSTRRNLLGLASQGLSASPSANNQKTERARCSPEGNLVALENLVSCPLLAPWPFRPNPEYKRKRPRPICLPSSTQIPRSNPTLIRFLIQGPN